MLHKLLSAIILVMLLSVLPAAADTLTIPNSFTDGTTASATQVNANFTAISTVVNGNIDNNNVKSSAAIALSKLDLTTELFVLRAAANRNISAGVTGDTVPRIGLASSGYLFFGPGSGTATDLMLKRTDANTLAVRNIADSADKNLTVGALTASGNVAGVNGTFSGPVAGTTATFSGAAQATALTLTTTPLPYTSGGTGLATAATGTVLVGNGTGYTAVGPGSSGQVLKSNGTTLSMGAVGGSFGGDGSAGAVTKGAVTETTQLQLNATTFSQTVSTTWAPLSGTIVNATSTCAFNGTTNVGYGCLGGLGATQAAAYPSRGSGPGGGSRGVNTGESGGGGSNAGDGGRAGSSFANTYTEKTKSYPMCRLGGSGGGGGGYASSAGGDGGKGGGVLIACAVGAMTVGASGTINADGEAGAAGGTGGGGGAGGDVSLNSQTSIANSGSILCRGGNGGNGSSAAGGATGAGGYIQFMSPSNTNGTRTVTAGATIGTGGTQVPTVGSAGLAVSITATPNLPLLLSMQSDNFARMKSVALAHKVLNFPSKEGFDVELTQREAAQACSRGSVIQFAKLVDGNMTESTCIEIGDAVEVLDNAA